MSQSPRQLLCRSDEVFFPQSRDNVGDCKCQIRSSDVATRSIALLPQTLNLLELMASIIPIGCTSRRGYANANVTELGHSIDR